MADEIPTVVSVPSAEVAVAPAPEVTPQPVGEAPAQAQPAEPAFKPHTETPTLLEEAAPKADPVETPKPIEEPKPEGEPKAVEVKPETKPEELKPVEVKPEVVPEPVAPEPIKYEFKFPDTVKPEAAAVTELSTVFNEGRVAPEVAQKIVDIGTKAMTTFADNYQKQTLENQHKVFAETRQGWRKDVMADPVLGGAGHQTAMAAVARMRDMLASDHRPGTKEYEADLTAFNDFLRMTGAGDHLAFLRVMHRAAQFFDEPAMPPAGAQPAPGNGARPGRRTMRDLYQQTRDSRGG